MRPALEGMGVLVTRPAHQSETLCRLIEQRGGRAIRFPALEILDPEDPQPALAVIERLEEFDLAIFISANAVHRGLALVRAQRELPSSLTIAAIGKATARALEHHGVPVSRVPDQGFSSEALLALPEMQAVAGHRVVIFRGEGGREKLADTLKARGARVTYAEVYRRGKPAADPQPLLQYWKQGKIQAVTAASSETLQNLFDIVGKLGHHWLRETPLVVVGARARQLALELGFSRPPLIAGEPGDEAIVEALQEIHRFSSPLEARNDG